MPTSLLVLFVTLRSILRSRVDLQLENVAPAPSNRRAATLGEEAPEIMLTSLDRQLIVAQIKQAHEAISNNVTTRSLSCQI
jgi:hypothetical protein